MVITIMLLYVLFMYDSLHTVRLFVCSIKTDISIESCTMKQEEVHAGIPTAVLSDRGEGEEEVSYDERYTMREVTVYSATRFTSQRC